MTSRPRLWMRSEVRQTERRAPIVPTDARRLTEQGLALTVEESAQRAFPVAEYRAAGCQVAPAGSWVDAPADQYIIGLKELPDLPAALAHRHVFFGHAYKGQRGAGELLDRFTAGRGALLDLEALVDDDGRRLAAFGFWAGYVGTALAVLHWNGQLTAPLQPLSKSALDSALREAAKGDPPRVLVIGALGRSGRGACGALATAGIVPTRWDVEETRQLDRAALLSHDILVNAVFTSRLVAPFMSQADLPDPARRLSLVSDITCDVTSDCNALPIYDSTTTWQQPVRRLQASSRPLDIIAIDNLPSLLPAEASVDFSAQLVPLLMALDGTAPHGRTLNGTTLVWQRCLRAFQEACHSTGNNSEVGNV
jgi:saccharopine dehydrogenase (NAD+, L-lysine-forming)